jgi:hypothetical protein
VRDHNEHPGDSDRRRRRNREQRRELARQMVEKAAGPPPFRVTLAQARARWAGWEAAHNERRLSLNPPVKGDAVRRPEMRNAL